MKLDWKKSLIASFLLLLLETAILKMNWMNDTVGRYQYFLNLIIIVVFQLVALRDFNQNNPQATNKDRMLFIIPFNLLITTIFVLGSGLLFQTIFTQEVAAAIREKSLLLEQSRASMGGKSLVQQNELIAKELDLIKKTFTWEGIFIFKGAITIFQSMLLGSILAFTLNGKKLFD
jgi:hypothetical protein